MTEQVKDLTTCTITNGPGGLTLDWVIHQDSEGRRFQGFTLDLNELYDVIRLVDTDGFLWASNDKGETWTKTDKNEFFP